MAINEDPEGGLEDEAELKALTLEQTLDDRNLLRNPDVLLVDPLQLNRLETLGYLEVTSNPGVWFVKS